MDCICTRIVLGRMEHYFYLLSRMALALTIASLHCSHLFYVLFVYSWHAFLVRLGGSFGYSRVQDTIYGGRDDYKVKLCILYG
jgi:hypothetical protein